MSVKNSASWPKRWSSVAKIDPDTGAVIWQRPLQPRENVWGRHKFGRHVKVWSFHQIEPVHGTNDVIVWGTGSYYPSAGGTASCTVLQRVPECGPQDFNKCLPNATYLGDEWSASSWEEDAQYWGTIAARADGQTANMIGTIVNFPFPNYYGAPILASPDGGKLFTQNLPRVAGEELQTGIFNQVTSIPSGSVWRRAFFYGERPIAVNNSGEVLCGFLRASTSADPWDGTGIVKHNGTGSGALFPGGGGAPGQYYSFGDWPVSPTWPDYDRSVDAMHVQWITTGQPGSADYLYPATACAYGTDWYVGGGSNGLGRVVGSSIVRKYNSGLATQWSSSAFASLVTRMVADSSGVYVVTPGITYNLQKLSHAGNTLWRQPASLLRGIPKSACIADNGYVYVCT